MELADSVGSEHIAVGELLERLAERGTGLLLLMLSLLMCVPNIPGISTVFGLLLIPPSLQMISGRASIWMPRWVRERALEGTRLRAALRASVPLLRRIEIIATPRLALLTQWPATSLVGMQTLTMALVLILPMWGANLIPGIAVVLTGLGMLQRDGALLLASTCVALAALAWVYFGTHYTVRMGGWLWSQVEAVL